MVFRSLSVLLASFLLLTTLSSTVFAGADSPVTPDAANPVNKSGDERKFATGMFSTGMGAKDTVECTACKNGFGRNFKGNAKQGGTSIDKDAAESAAHK